jgi:hypothetical protein
VIELDRIRPDFKTRLDFHVTGPEEAVEESMRLAQKYWVRKQETEDAIRGMAGNAHRDLACCLLPAACAFFIYSVCLLLLGRFCGRNHRIS